MAAEASSAAGLGKDHDDGFDTEPDSDAVREAEEQQPPRPLQPVHRSRSQSQQRRLMRSQPPRQTARL